MSWPTGHDSDDKPRRLFLALTPDISERQQLQAAVHDKLPLDQARWVPAENLHLTLVFLGSVSSAVQACVEQALAQVAAAPFAVTLDRLGYWPRKRMLWAMPSTTPAALIDLVEVMQVLAQDCGVSLVAQSYKAHVTVARKVNGVPHGSHIPAVSWIAKQFSLLESVPTAAGVRYIERAAWPLRTVD